MKDYLNRTKDINRFLEMMDLFAGIEANISFAVDGAWGCGKTFFLKEIEDKLNESKYMVFHYDCWKYDYYDEPLVAIVSMMIKQIKEKIEVRSKNLSKKEKKVLYEEKNTENF